MLYSHSIFFSNEIKRKKENYLNKIFKWLVYHIRFQNEISIHKIEKEKKMPFILELKVESYIQLGKST